MVLLDKLLPKLKERDSRVLIFSQVSYLQNMNDWDPQDCYFLAQAFAIAFYSQLSVYVHACAVFSILICH